MLQHLQRLLNKLSKTSYPRDCGPAEGPRQHTQVTDGHWSAGLTSPALRPQTSSPRNGPDGRHLLLEKQGLGAGAGGAQGPEQRHPPPRRAAVGCTPLSSPCHVIPKTFQLSANRRSAKPHGHTPSTGPSRPAEGQPPAPWETDPTGHRPPHLSRGSLCSLVTLNQFFLHRL